MMQKVTTNSILREFDDTGHERAVFTLPDKGPEIRSRLDKNGSCAFDAARFLKGAFLPVGYPLSVSSDYLQYQVYNALQAFCSSLASLIASRAVLEGHGVGDANASATNALLLTIMQDVFSRFTTILSAYYLGASLFPEAKTYRLLADVFNDAAMILDTLSPLFGTITFGITTIPCRGLALCLSGGFRAICGLAAGGAKAAITMHFAQPQDPNAQGDIGDLNAKDGSKETVLALFGMLCGSALIPYLRDPYTTYATLFVLVAVHLALNYIGVRGVIMHSLNRQRARIVWSTFRAADAKESSRAPILSPTKVSIAESIFANPSHLYHATRPGIRRVSGSCTIGDSLSAILPRRSSRPTLTQRLCYTASIQVPPLDAPALAELLALQDDEKYILWVGPRSRAGHAEIVVVLKEGHGPSDHLRAWLHATELAGCLPMDQPLLKTEVVMDAVRTSKKAVELHIPRFLEGLKGAGWNLEAPGGGFITGALRALRVEQDDRKTR